MFDTLRLYQKLWIFFLHLKINANEKKKMEMYASSDEYKLLWEKWIWNQNFNYKCPNFTFEMEKLKIKQTVFRF